MSNIHNFKFWGLQFNISYQTMKKKNHNLQLRSSPSISDSLQTPPEQCLGKASVMEERWGVCPLTPPGLACTPDPKSLAASVSKEVINHGIFHGALGGNPKIENTVFVSL